MGEVEITKHGVPMGKWGKDHWSLLAYIEAVCVDSIKGIGKPNAHRVQTNHNRHPLMGNPFDGAEFGIRLKGGEELPGPDYDEWDCFDDLETVGLIQNLGSGLHRAYKFTNFGNIIVGQLRKHKTEGGNFAEFEPDLTVIHEGVFE